MTDIQDSVEPVAQEERYINAVAFDGITDNGRKNVGNLVVALITNTYNDVNLIRGRIVSRFTDDQGDTRVKIIESNGTQWFCLLTAVKGI